MEDIPVFKIEGVNLPSAWEQSVLRVWNDGIKMKTEYDKKDDTLSRDCSMIMIVKNPLSEPRIHRAFPGGLEDLEIYRQEVIDGIHDSWINPAEGKWSYTYHQRLFNFESDIHQKAKNIFIHDKSFKADDSCKGIDQIKYLIDKLAESYYSRRAQAITWDPDFDPKTDDPPCLQRVWCRITKSPDDIYYLNMNTHWRSRDAYKAAFMNMFAFTDLQTHIAKEISKKIKKEVKIGRYVDISDSYHIYGAYDDEVESFIKIVKERSFPDRTWDTKFAESFLKQVNPD